MIDVVTFKWTPTPGYRSKFEAAHVNTLRAMVARHYQRPHRFTCVTDDPSGLDPRIRVIPLWPDHAELLSPHGKRNPSCYRRMRLFARDAGDIIGPRFVVMDLDAVVVGDLGPVWDRSEEIVFWAGTAGKNPYNGSMVLMSAGARPQVWEKFDPVMSPRMASRMGYVGSDQAWIAACLGPGEARWTNADGVYSWRMQLRFKRGILPPDARLVFFHGHNDPWSPRARAEAPWIAKHWHDAEPACSPARLTAG